MEAEEEDILFFLLLVVLVEVAQIMLELAFLVQQAIHHLHPPYKVLQVVMVLIQVIMLMAEEEAGVQALLVGMPFTTLQAVQAVQVQHLL